MPNFSKISKIWSNWIGLKALAKELFLDIILFFFPAFKGLFKNPLWIPVGLFISLWIQTIQLCWADIEAGQNQGKVWNIKIA